MVGSELFHLQFALLVVTRDFLLQLRSSFVGVALHLVGGFLNRVRRRLFWFIWHDVHSFEKLGQRLSIGVAGRHRWGQESGETRRAKSTLDGIMHGCHSFR